MEPTVGTVQVSQVRHHRFRQQESAAEESVPNAPPDARQPKDEVIPEVSPTGERQVKFAPPHITNGSRELHPMGSERIVPGPLRKMDCPGKSHGDQLVPAPQVL